MNILVATDSESGNTMEIALEIAAAMREAGCTVREHRINGPSPLTGLPPLDLVFAGSYTWGYGAAPASTEWFMEEHSFDCPVACFGSGETQWGLEYFCGAADLLARRFASPFSVFKQEQMPNSRERLEIRAWATDILNKVRHGTGTHLETAMAADTVGFEAFRQDALQGEWLVEFYKDNCVPCKMLGKSLEKLQAGTNVLKVHLDGDADFEQALGDFGIQSVPTLMLVRDGQLLHQSAGFKSPADLNRLVDQHFSQAMAAA